MPVFPQRQVHYWLAAQGLQNFYLPRLDQVFVGFVVLHRIDQVDRNLRTQLGHHVLDEC